MNTTETNKTPTPAILPPSCKYEAMLREELAKNPRLMVMTAENRAMLRNLPAFAGPRFVDTGITEQWLAGFASGLALRGRTPVIHALAPFLTMRAFEFIRTDAGLGKLPVKCVGFVPGLLSDGNGATHQSLEDVSLMRGIPGMQVFSPADEDDLVAAMPGIIESPFPTYVRYNNRAPVVTHAAKLGVGEAEVLKEGTDVLLLVHGTLFKEAFEAATALEAQGKSVGLVNVRWLKPFDAARILPLVAKAKTTFTIEDHFRTGGLNSVLAEHLMDAGQTAKVHSISFEEKWFRPGTLPAVLENEQLTGEHLARRILGKI